MRELKEKINNKEEINYLDLIFLPLMKSDQEIAELVKYIIELEEKLEIDQNLKDNIVALTFVLSDKFLTEAEISEIWRDYKMVKILKYAEEQGKKKGKEEGKIEGKIEGKQEEARLILMRQIKAKFGKLDNEIINLINDAELSKIEDLSEKIVTTNLKEELIDFLKH
jgi:predicted transposase YdaD